MGELFRRKTLAVEEICFRIIPLSQANWIKLNEKEDTVNWEKAVPADRPVTVNDPREWMIGLISIQVHLNSWPISKEKNESNNRAACRLILHNIEE
jgi:hypothetical protein